LRESDKRRNLETPIQYRRRCAMKFLVTAKPGPMPPPIDVVRAAREWLQGKLDDGTFECVYAFPQGGGCSIGENESLEGLMEQLLDYPLSPFVELDVRPLVEMDAAFDRLIPYIERATAQLTS
jgi:hypothetical protein